MIIILVVERHVGHSQKVQAVLVKAWRYSVVLVTVQWITILGCVGHSSEVQHYSSEVQHCIGHSPLSCNTVLVTVQWITMMCWS